jgi:hypothetical protein
MIEMKKSSLSSVQISISVARQRLSIGSYKASPSSSPMSALPKYMDLVKRISVALSFMVESFCLIARWLSCMTPCLARWSLVLLMA